MRPQTLDQIVGQQHLLAPNQMLRRLIDADRVPSMILWGPPEVPHNCWTKDPMIVRYFFYVKIFFRIKITDC